MKITNWIVQQTSQKGQSLLVSVELRGVCPEVSIQLPTEVADKIKRRWDLIDNVSAVLKQADDAGLFDARTSQIIGAPNEARIGCRNLIKLLDEVS